MAGLFDIIDTITIDAPSSIAPPKRKDKHDYTSIIDKYSKLHTVDPDLIKSVIEIESSGGRNAVESKTGAKGLMQLMPDTVKRFKVKDVEDPDENIRGGTAYLSELLKKYDYDAEHALAAYHAGTTGYNRKGKKLSKMGPETQAYVPKVMQVYKDRKGSGMI